MLAELTRRLKTLHLYGMAAELTEMGVERVRKPEAPEVWLQRLVDGKHKAPGTLHALPAVRGEVSCPPRSGQLLKCIPTRLRSGNGNSASERPTYLVELLRLSRRLT